MVPHSVSRFSGVGVAAALLLSTGLIPQLALAQTSPATPRMKQAAPARDANTIGIIRGSPEESAILFVNEIARVLARGQETGPNGELALRVLPIVGRGGVHDLRDVLSLPGVDMAIIQEPLLSRVQDSKELGDLKSRLVYITKLFNEELHVIARKDIRQVSDLTGKLVNLGDSSGSAEAVVRDVFRSLGLQVSEAHMGQDEAIEEMRQGKVAATAVLAAKPAAIVERLTRGGGFHLISIPFPADAAPYLPTSLRHTDYPNLIPAERTLETVAVGTVLVAYNWPEKSSRYHLLGNFVDMFFSRFSEFQAASRGPKWQEINLAAILPDWKRFKPAERWLQNLQAQQTGVTSTGAVSRSNPSRTPAPNQRSAETERLFEDFLQWSEQQGGR